MIPNVPNVKGGNMPSFTIRHAHPEGKISGPYSAQELSRLISSGQISTNDSYCIDDDQQWFSVSQFQYSHRASGVTPHRGSLILTFGILSLCLPFIGFIFGLLAWIFSGKDLKKMNTGEIDPSGRGNTKAGRICGIIGFYVGMFFLLVFMSAFAVPQYLRYVEKARSTEAQTAILALKTVYDAHIQAKGNSGYYAMETAIQDAHLTAITMTNWDFGVVGYPPKMYVATSKAEFASGEGKQVWYDTDEAKFHGYGVDNWTNPDNSCHVIGSNLVAELSVVK